MSITADPKPTDPTPRDKQRPFKPLDALMALASLKLTVVLFVLSFLLVFFGTLAQIDFGIWTVVSTYFRSFYVFVPFNIFLQFGQIFFGLPKEWTEGTPWRIGGAFPFPGGWTLAILLMANLLAAHFVRFKLSWKRAGILVLHAGLIVMLTGEIITGLYAVEGNMVIEEGETVRVVTDNRVCELAVIDPTNARTDTVTTVPSWMLRRKGTISHEDLPFDIVPVRYMVNSELKKPGKDNPATAGLGLEAEAAERAEGSGVSLNQKADAPSVYVKLLEKGTGKEIGTYVFSLWLQEPQEITVGDVTYDVQLRFRQTQRPFSLTLKKFTFDRYPGTETPLNFASEVELNDPVRGDEERKVTIRMNEPLRHAGETFFQASWNEKTEKGTVLQVVRNPAWQLPYWSCGIVTLGLLMHFSVSLVEFLKKRGA